MLKYLRRNRHFVFTNLRAIFQWFSNQKLGHLKEKQYNKLWKCLFLALEQKFNHVKLYISWKVIQIPIQIYIAIYKLAYTFFKMVVANLCNLRFFRKLICMHVFDWSANTILLKIDIHVRFTMMHVWKSRFKKKILLVVANLCNLQFFCTVMTDLLTRFCWKLIYMSVLWWSMSKRIVFFKITIGSCKFMQLAMFCK